MPFPSPAIGRLTAFVALALVACNASPAPGPEAIADVRILFIGNSLTSYNDMPAMVADIGRANGVTIAVTRATRDGTALVDHLSTGPAAVEASRGGWTAVVMQQGPTPAGICRDTLVLATRAFAPAIRAGGGVPATLMPWPDASRPGDFAAVRESAAAASRAVDGLLLPAGDAWLAAWRTSPSLQLYGADGFHPTALGSYLTALVVYAGVTGTDARTLSPVARLDGGRTQLPEATVRLLQRAAADALEAAPRDTPRANEAVLNGHSSSLRSLTTC